MMRIKSLVFALLLLPLTGLSSCQSSAQSGGRYLYEPDADPPRLLDSEIRMETQRRIKGRKTPDLRIIRCQNGKISASLRSEARWLEGEAELPFAAYAQAWEAIMNGGGFSQKSEEIDPRGSYYHLISFRMGSRLGITSGQNRSNFAGLQTANILERLEIANVITRIIDKNVAVHDIPRLPNDESKKRRSATQPTSAPNKP